MNYNVADQKLCHHGTTSEKTACHEITVGDVTKREDGKFCLHELCVQGSSEASKRIHQGKTAGEKSEMGVTLEIIHGLVTIEGR